MGMPGSSEYLQELTSRVFGDFLQEGFIVIIADDLFIGGTTISSLVSNWAHVLGRLKDNNLTLSSSKTVICPKETIILGWQWNSGTLSPCSHKISALASVSPPKTRTAMRSFIGAFKALSRCIPRYASLVSSLEDSIKGLDGNHAIDWTDDLYSHFARIQTALKSPSILTIPKPSDQLVLTVDASPIHKGLGATLFLQRDNKRHLAQFYSFKVKEHQIGWFPCEFEALAIATGVNYFAPYIRESVHPLQILTDNKPCVQAFNRLCSGQFSASSQVSTFLATLSANRVTVNHLPGISNLSSNYGSRNHVHCENQSCQICKFVQSTAQSVVNVVEVQDILSGNVPMPFVTKSAWRSAQHDCPDLRRAYAHLSQGTRPSRKSRNLKHLRQYLQVASIDDQGVIVVYKDFPGYPNRALIVVPVDLLPGIITALHLNFKHASKHQLKLVFGRYFFGIKSSSVIERVIDNCELCNSLKAVPKEVFSQSLSLSASTPGVVFFADILRRSCQKICVVRDVHTSYTTASIVPDEKGETLRTALLLNTNFIRAPNCTIHIDQATGFLSLRDDALLSDHGIKLDLDLLKTRIPIQWWTRRFRSWSMSF